MRLSDYLEEVGRPVTYYPKLCKPLGGVTAAAFFNQVFYWWNKGRTHELGVYKTAEEWETETGLTVQEQRTARKKLRDLGVLIETNKKLEHRIYYALDLDKFNELFTPESSNIPEMQYQHSGSTDSTFDEVANQHSGSTDSTFVNNTRDYLQETTQEITTTPIVPIATPEKTQSKNPSDKVSQVFDYWKKRLNHEKARIDAKRKKTINEALKCGYSVADLCQAVNGCSLTPFNMGENDKGQVYDSLHIILKDADQIDRFMANADRPPVVLNKQQQLEATNLAALKRLEEKQAEGQS